MSTEKDCIIESWHLAAARRVWTLFRDLRRRNEAWAGGESDEPANPDVAAFDAENAAAGAGGRETDVLIGSIARLIAEEASGVAEAAAVAAMITAEFGPRLEIKVGDYVRAVCGDPPFEGFVIRAHWPTVVVADARGGPATDGGPAFREVVAKHYRVVPTDESLCTDGSHDWYRLRVKGSTDTALLMWVCARCKRSNPSSLNPPAGAACHDGAHAWMKHREVAPDGTETDVLTVSCARCGLKR